MIRVLQMTALRTAHATYYLFHVEWYMLELFNGQLFCLCELYRIYCSLGCACHQPEQERHVCVGYGLTTALFESNSGNASTLHSDLNRVTCVLICVLTRHGAV